MPENYASRDSLAKHLDLSNHRPPPSRAEKLSTAAGCPSQEYCHEDRRGDVQMGKRGPEAFTLQLNSKLATFL